MRLPIYTAAFTGLMAGPALAADLELSLEIPRLTVAEYHRPYVAVWIENQDKTAVKTLAVWYDVKLKNQEGQKWLKDMRQWWRRAGRDMSLPADGVSAATRAPGKHQVVFKGGATFASAWQNRSAMRVGPHPYNNGEGSAIRLLRELE